MLSALIRAASQTSAVYGCFERTVMSWIANIILATDTADHEAAAAPATAPRRAGAGPAWRSQWPACRSPGYAGVRCPRQLAAQRPYNDG